MGKWTEKFFGHGTPTAKTAITAESISPPPLLAVMAVTAVSPASPENWDYRILDDQLERAAIQSEGASVPSIFVMDDTEDLDSLLELPPLRGRRN